MVRWRRSKLVASTALVVVLSAVQPALLAQGGPGDGQHWVGTWATALVARPPQDAAQPAPAEPPLHFNDQTLRQIVHTSLGGDRLRVVLSNTFGTTPLEVGAARVALRGKAAIVAGSARPLTFSGRAATSIPAGATVVSDPVDLSVPQAADLAIDVYLPGNTASGSSPLTMHSTGLSTGYVSAPGNHTGAAVLPVARTVQSWHFLARVEVRAPAAVGAVVTFGDSITDGTRSTPDTNNRWPDHLARRFAAAGIRMGVLNAGIGGNQVLIDGNGVNALARFDRDVLVQPGITHVTVLVGINDIRRTSPSPETLIAAYRQLILRARAAGLRIYGATLTPCEGASRWTKEVEATRLAVNEWIRTRGEYDAVIDFDAAVRDPKQPSKFLPEFDSGDHLHPSDAGYKAMADAIDLGLFRAAQRQPTTAAAR
jgi:lysophospholipase L1-like esterase